MDQTTIRAYAKSFNEFAKKHNKTISFEDLEGILRGLKGTDEEIETALFQATCRLCQHEDAYANSKSGIKSFLSLVIFRCLFRSQDDGAEATDPLSDESLTSSEENPEFGSRLNEFLNAASKVHHRAAGFVQSRLDGKTDIDLAKIWGVSPQMVQRWRYQYEMRIAELFAASFEGTAIQNVLSAPMTETAQAFAAKRARGIAPAVQTRMQQAG